MTTKDIWWWTNNISEMVSDVECSNEDEMCLVSDILSLINEFENSRE